MLAEHQREAVERSLELLERRGGLLLADEVGLGKSYVAAEVMRRCGGEIDLIVPVALVAQWRATLAQFGVTASVLTHDALLSDRFVPQPAERLVVVDEAHAFRNRRTRRYAALARRTVAARVMLVTATPICNSISDLESLVRLIACDDLLARAGVPSIDAAFADRDAEAIERIVAELVIRRDRSVVPAALQFGELDRRVLWHAVPDARIIDELQFPLVGERALLRRFLRRRLESSEAALVESVRRQLRFYGRALSAMAAGRTLPKRDYRRAFAHEEDRDAFQEILFWDLFAPAGDADPRAVHDEVARLEALIASVDESPREKRGMLVELAQAEREPMLVFTGSAATANDIYDALSVVRRCGIITSRVRSRDAVLKAFREGLLDAIVSTDLAGEGLNLQRAGMVVHYDLPWNPVRLDQRNGRAYRIGQTRPTVRAVYFIPRSRATGIVETVARKNRVRRRTLRASSPRSRDTPPTLRPRLTSDSAFVRLAAVAPTELPDTLARRHKAGLEQLMAEMSGEFLDRRRIDELVALAELERRP